MIKVLIPLIISLTALAIVLFLIFGKRQSNWDEMTTEERNRKKVMIFSGIGIFIAGIITAVFMGKRDRTDVDNNLK